MENDNGSDEERLGDQFPDEAIPWTSDEKSERGQWFREMLEQHLPEVDVPALGGSETIYLHRELRFCYVNGQFVSSIILAASVIEQVLVRAVSLKEESYINNDPHLYSAINKAKELEIIPGELAEQALELKDLRNDYVHYRDRTFGDRSPSVRRKEKWGMGAHLPFRIGEKDAETAIEISIKIRGELWNDVNM